MSQPLQTLLEHAENERDAAVARLASAEEHARRLLQQSEQLQTYREEYRSRHPAQGGRSAGIDLIRCHQQFMHRLDLALAQLQLQVQQCNARSGALRGELVAFETRVASVRKLLERRANDAQRVADRQEQRRSDEAAQRALQGARMPSAWRGDGPPPLC